MSARSDAPQDRLTVRLWFEVGCGMQASLHLGSSIHRFTGTRQLVSYLRELDEEPETLEVSSAV